MVGFSSEFDQEIVSDNFNILEHGFDAVFSVSSDGVEIREANYIGVANKKAEFDDCQSDGTSSDQYTNEFSPSGFFMGQIRRRRRFEQVQDVAKNTDDADVKSDSSIGFYGHDNAACEGACDSKELKSNSNEYTTEVSPSGFFVGWKLKVRSKVYHSDEESEPSVGYSGDRDACDEVESKATTTSNEYSPLRLWDSNYTSNEYSPSGFFMGKKFKAAANYDDDTKSEDSVGYCGENNVPVTEEQSEEIADFTGKQKLVTKRKRKASNAKQKLKKNATATVKEVGERQIVVSALMAPQICPWRDSKGQLKKRCVFKQ